jgi:tetratricopeptide (TPR) repeat protein
MPRISALCLLALSLALPARPQAPASPEPSAANAEPKSPTAAASQLLARGRLDDALKELDTLAAQSPEPAGVERLRGFALYQQGKLQDADAALAKALAQNPADREAMQLRGTVLYRLGRPADALPLLEQGRVSIGAVNIDPNYVLGLCYIDLRRYDDARHAFAAEYGFEPDSAPAYLLAGRMMLRHENPAAAEQATDKALALDPRLPLAHQLLGEIALARGNVQGAIQELEKERALDPLFAGVYDRLGDAYTRAGEYDKAQDVLNRAVLLDPNATGPYIQLGKALLKQDNPVMATMYLERALAMDPGNYITHTLLAQAYRATGRKDDATREFQLSEKLQSGNVPKGVH